MWRSILDLSRHHFPHINIFLTNNFLKLCFNIKVLKNTKRLFNLVSAGQNGIRLAWLSCFNPLWTNFGSVSRRSIFSRSDQPDHISQTSLPQWSQVHCAWGHLQVNNKMKILKGSLFISVVSVFDSLWMILRQTILSHWSYSTLLVYKVHLCTLKSKYYVVKQTWYNNIIPHTQNLDTK